VKKIKKQITTKILISMILIIVSLIGMGAVSAVDNNSADSVSSDELAFIEISGQVSQCSDEEPFPGATVTVKDNGTEMDSTTTNSDGTYNLRFQSINRVFTVTANANGHKPTTQEVVASEKSNGTYTGTVNFKLGNNDAYVYQGWVTNPDEDYTFSDGTTIHLTGATNAFTTIDEGITYATGNPGVNTVYIAPGTYNEYSMSIDTSVNLRGENQDTTIIDANDNARILTVWNGAIVNIEKLTFRDGASEYGGALRVESGTTTITDCTFDSNTVPDYGGAIYVDYGATVTISGSTFTDNTAYDGGAIYNDGGMLTINRSTFTSNQASGTNYGGGAILNSINGGTVNLADCIFTSNRANGFAGGAIYNRYILNVENCTFNSNTAYFYGGAISAGRGTNTITGSTFNGNTADSGGAIAVSIADTFTVNGSNFIGNSATSMGGAIFSTIMITANFNRFYNNNGPQGSAIYTLGTSNVENNWWGTNNPIFSSLIIGAPTPKQWLYMTINAAPATINNTQTSLVTVSFNNRYNGTTVTSYTPGVGEYIPNGTPVTFSLTNGPFGTLKTPLTANTLGGLASILFTATNVGVQDVNGTLDDQKCTASVTINPSTYVDVHSQFRDLPWGNDITTAKYNDKVYVMVKVQNQGPDSTSLSVLNTLTGITWTGNYYVLSGSINPSDPGNWVLNDAVNTFNGKQWNIPFFSASIGGNVKWLAIEGIINRVGTVSNYAETESQGSYPYRGYDSDTCELYVPSADLYIVITSNKNKPKVGEIFTIRYKLGNKGPDDAENVTITIKLPDEFVISKIKGDGTWTIKGNTIIWTMKNVKVGDPYLYISGWTTRATSFLFGATINSDTFNINTQGVSTLTVKTQPKINAATNTTVNGKKVAMQTTGTPIVPLALAVLSVLCGLVITRKKQ
jgi:predicted outer membrane repeat protein